jgi:hypothetical protein
MIRGLQVRGGEVRQAGESAIIAAGDHRGWQACRNFQRSDGLVAQVLDPPLMIRNRLSTAAHFRAELRPMLADANPNPTIVRTLNNPAKLALATYNVTNIDWCIS